MLELVTITKKEYKKLLNYRELVLKWALKDDVSPKLPLVSVGPSGVGGEYQKEIFEEGK